MTRLRVLFLMLPAAGLLAFFLGTTLTLGQISSIRPVVWTDIPIGPPAIVIGFGGFIKYDNPVHGEVQLADRLRKEYPTGVDVETFESYRGQEPAEKFCNSWAPTIAEL